MTTPVKRKATELALADAKKPKANSSITSFFALPKSSPSSQSSLSLSSSSSLPFDKANWASTLTSEQRDLLSLELSTLDPSWLSSLKDDLLHPSFLSLKRFLASERSAGTTIFPPAPDIYSWSRHTPLPSVKCVILGQDPYHNYNQAHGLCFSVRPPTPAPPSLKNMYICLRNDYPAFSAPPKSGGLLTPWAERGVLMINTCLTVRAHQANSHAAKGWERFTQRVIDIVAAKRKTGVVFLAWGSPAGKRVAGVDRKRHCVLQSVHPSPLSAHKGFLTCGHFRKTNDWLQDRYGDEGPINWNLGGTSVPESKANPAAAEPKASSPVAPLNTKQPIAGSEKPAKDEMIPAAAAVAEKSEKLDATKDLQEATAPEKAEDGAGDFMTEEEMDAALSDTSNI